MLGALQFRLFAIYYSMGSIVSLGGTGFVVGAKKQCKGLTNRKRGGAGAVYLLMIIVTMSYALGTDGPSGILCFIFAFIQFFAQWYYMLSYIPGGKKLGKAIGKKLGKKAVGAS